MPRLIWVHPANDEPIEIGDRPLQFGRDDESDVQLLEVRASRRHFVIEPCEGGHRIADQESANGTRVNGNRIRQRRLRRGDEIRVGECRLIYEGRGVDADDRGRAPRRAPPYPFSMLLVPLVIGVVGAVGLVLFDGIHQKEVDQARSAVARADLDAAYELPDATSQREALLAWIAAHPNDEHVTQARSGIDKIDKRFRHETEARKELDRLLAGSERFDPAELRDRLEWFIRRFGDVPSVVPAARDRLRAVADAERAAYATRFEAARAESTRRLNDGDFGGAVAALNGFLLGNPGIDADTRTLAEGVSSRIYGAARTSWRELQAEVDALSTTDREGASKKLRAELGRFAGTPYHAEGRLRLEELVASVDAPSPGTDDVVAKAERRRSRATYYLQAQQAEELARVRYYDGAIERYRELLDGCEIPEITSEFQARLGELEGCAALMKRLRGEMDESPKKFRRIELAGVKGSLSVVDDREIRLDVKDGQAGVPWVDITVRDLVRLVDRIRPTPEELLAVAALQFDENDRDGWRESILMVMETGKLKERVDELYARKEGLPLPEGGFVAYKGLILSTKEHRRELRRERIIELNTDVVELIERLDKTDSMKQVAVMRERRKELDEKRAFALKLIFDEVRYFYPYRNRMGEYTPVQTEVDERVAAVRELWDDETRFSLKRSGEVAKLLKRCDEAVVELRALEVDPSAIEFAIERRRIYFAEEKTTLTIRTFFLDAGDRDRIAYDHRVLGYNASDPTNATLNEWKQVDITNAYRMMFARRAVVRDDLLTITARKHSEEMGRLGYFAHESPVPARRDPFKRSRIEGYKGMPISENIHQGSGDPQSAHNRWAHSSGHHRNILNAVWTDMGTGVDGNRWTQNFGHTALLSDGVTKRSDGR